MRGCIVGMGWCMKRYIRGVCEQEGLWCFDSKGISIVCHYWIQLLWFYIVQHTITTKLSCKCYLVWLKQLGRETSFDINVL